ncbi:DMT family transporter [secondary endosymbiont of Ctenarytaina eucalypti]|uniref:Undecaprenyl phosphate-aminoarabinose flippase subunit ArnE n=1 Tax=secondary endosymbiont of Ctenarytaina eucalypti TaxID=1199245 RepID=J3VT27_9ENTR|nr:4-amino-4-deoxy-L-arabinose-phospho-UDP flippase subunit E [secondary endosymbiont of Ctenarytaina eucalypti]AFP85121.1 hypothetical protein A359_07510 [secondary endosymbiont of Ctenarytaina eucalypti]
MIYLLIFVVVLLSCAGQLCQKYAANMMPGAGTLGARLRWIATSFLLLAGAFVAWLWVLQRAPIGIVYPILSINFLLVTLATRLLWLECISLRHGIGLLLMVSGIVIMGASL